jgi:hypothetical protein
MLVTREELLRRREIFRQERDQWLAKLGAAEQGIQECEYWLSVLDQPVAPVAPQPPAEKKD